MLQGSSNYITAKLDDSLFTDECTLSAPAKLLAILLDNMTRTAGFLIVTNYEYLAQRLNTTQARLYRHIRELELNCYYEKESIKIGNTRFVVFYKIYDFPREDSRGLPIEDTRFLISQLIFQHRTDGGYDVI